MGCAIPKIKVIGLVPNTIRHIIYGKHSAIRKHESFFSFLRGETADVPRLFFRSLMPLMLQMHPNF